MQYTPCFHHFLASMKASQCKNGLFDVMVIAFGPEGIADELKLRASHYRLWYADSMKIQMYLPQKTTWYLYWPL